MLFSQNILPLRVAGFPGALLVYVLIEYQVTPDGISRRVFLRF